MEVSRCPSPCPRGSLETKRRQRSTERGARTRTAQVSSQHGTQTHIQKLITPFPCFFLPSLPPSLPPFPTWNPKMYLLWEMKIYTALCVKGGREGRKEGRKEGEKNIRKNGEKGEGRGKKGRREGGREEGPACTCQ